MRIMDKRTNEMFPRRKTVRIQVGGVAIGGGAPISVQSMTKTDTRDVRATSNEIRRLVRAGCEIVRLAIPDETAARAFAAIRKKSTIPLIADIHFQSRLALICLDGGADGLRLNPGTIGPVRNVREVVRAAGKRCVPIRIGINSGSVEKDILKIHGAATPAAMVESALRHIRILEDLDFRAIKVSLKASDVRRTVEAYRLLARKTSYPFHAGITEAGTLLPGAVKSAVGLSLLLREGLADTLRVSLTARPEEEVRVAYGILSAAGVRSRGANVISCPACGRCEVDLRPIALEVERRTAKWTAPITLAVMGCPVNGPGEAREADVGVACGRGVGVLFAKGKILRRIPEDRIAAEVVREGEKLMAEKETENDPDSTAADQPFFGR